jgi:hypothetical protein
VSLNITVPDEIAQAARARAMETGVSPEALLVEVLRTHFGPRPTELREELDAWERASDQDFGRLEADTTPD